MAHKLSLKEVSEIAELVELAALDFSMLHRDYREKKSGYLTILEEESGQVLSLQKILTCPLKKEPGWRTNSVEKAERLFVFDKHILSRESRDVSKLRYTGAVRYGGYIFSFSGLTEDGDEAVCFLALIKGALKMSEVEALEICKKNKNEILGKLLAGWV